MKKLKTEKKMGVWVNGKLELQSRDREAIYDLAERAMNNRRNTGVWVAPIGSFVTAGGD